MYAIHPKIQQKTGGEDIGDEHHGYCVGGARVGEKVLSLVAQDQAAKTRSMEVEKVPLIITPLARLPNSV